jgi:hypothetical protein
MGCAMPREAKADEPARATGQLQHEDRVQQPSPLQAAGAEWYSRPPPSARATAPRRCRTPGHRDSAADPLPPGSLDGPSGLEGSDTWGTSVRRLANLIITVALAVLSVCLGFAIVESASCHHRASTYALWYGLSGL